MRAASPKNAEAHPDARATSDSRPPEAITGSISHPGSFCLRALAYWASCIFLIAAAKMLENSVPVKTSRSSQSGHVAFFRNNVNLPSRLPFCLGRRKVKLQFVSDEFVPLSQKNANLDPPDGMRGRRSIHAGTFAAKFKPNSLQTVLHDLAKLFRCRARAKRLLCLAQIHVIRDHVTLIEGAARHSS